MGTFRKVGIAVGYASLGAAAAFVTGDLTDGFNANSSVMQNGMKGLGIVGGGLGGYYVSVKTGWDSLKRKGPTHGTSGQLGAAIISMPFLAAWTIALAGAGAYGGYRAANTGLDAIAKIQQPLITPAKPSPQ